VAIDRRLLLNVDWVLLGTTLLLAAVGVAMIASATHGGRFEGLHVRQLYALAIGLAALVAAVAVDYRRLADRAVLLYGLSLVALVAVLLFAPRIAGTRRWFPLGPLGQLQPSELVKIAAALFLARVFSESRKESLGFRDVAAPGAAIALLAVLIAREPDLGTAACLVPPFLAAAYLAGLRTRAIAGLFLVLAVTGALWWEFGSKPYQKERVYNFLDPDRDPQRAGYQRNQSQIAVGSGGLLGKGYMNGSQSQLGYLPARQTDFIFSVLAEEMGFLGVALVLGLYLLLLWRILETAQLARDRTGAMLSAAIAAMLAFQVVYNVAMVAGLVPVKGLPLPLMSYGGSSVVSTLLGIGLVLNVRMRRFAN
jgi:rod shape determining protein RodA